MAEPVMEFDDFTLTPLTAADVPLVVEWRSRPEVYRWYGGRPVDEEHIRTRHLESDEPVHRCIVRYRGDPIGYLQFYEYTDEWKPAVGLAADEEAWGIDLFIGEPHLHGKGVGTALVRGVAERLAAERGAERVLIDPHVDNQAAIRAYQKAGFRKVRLLPSYERMRGEWKDAWLMEWNGSADRAADGDGTGG